VTPVAIGAAMLQSNRWRDRPCAGLPDWQSRVSGVFSTPLLERDGEGWRALVQAPAQ
jgi:hypothetical protein